MMKSKLILWFSSLMILVALPGWAALPDLNGEWVMRRADESVWRPARVPGCVHTDLLRLGEIPDPYVGRNDLTLQWIGEKDWIYRKSFRIDSADLRQEHLQLVFEGLDTYADIRLNDRPLASTDNMFRRWRFDVKELLVPGENSLEIRFNSVFKVNMPTYLAAPYRLQAWPNNDQSDIYLSVYSRKAGFHYGWDWGPRLITCGVWRPVRLEAWSGERLESARISTLEIEKSRARMAASLKVEAPRTCDATAEVVLDGRVLARTRVQLQAGDNRIDLPFTVNRPRLWWSNGLGEAALYTFQCRVKCPDRLIERSVTTGIRTIELVRDADSVGRSFYFRLNGVPVFMKGANYIPQDNFQDRVTPERYRKMIDAAADAHMNMLRIWGGGIYEEDLFYDLCDRRGILVWQDMMFACGMFPGDRAFEENVREEVVQQVDRLYNHPSLALWCGNNENSISWYGWGWRDLTDEKYRAVYEANLHRLFEEVIPEAIRTVDTLRPYHPSSPATGYNGIGYNEGDVHEWWVWKGGMVEEYDSRTGRFVSEYGFQSYPEMSTLRTFAAEKDLSLHSTVMLSHQRARHDDTRDPEFGNKLMEFYIGHYFRVPESFPDFVYMSQLMQAEAVKFAIEAHRRKMPYCMGSLYWQIDDCWPVASWSSIDYFGRWKALHYFARKAYRPVILTALYQGDTLRVHAVSDRLEEARATLLLRVVSFDGKRSRKVEIPVSVPGNASTVVCEMPVGELYGGIPLNEACVVATLTDMRGTVLTDNIFYGTLSNRINYPQTVVERRLEPADGGFRLTLSSEGFTRAVALEVEDSQTSFSENYFDLLPGEPFEVHISTTLSKADLEKQLQIKSLNEVDARCRR